MSATPPTGASDRAAVFTAEGSTPSVEVLISSLLQGQPFLARQAAADRQVPPAWFVIAGWPMTLPRSEARAR
jgi:hypothetical protein